tara:strand:- start:3118 stop:3561 length:444 start_codon:yes stop_codon:yes gene_type:complete
MNITIIKFFSMFVILFIFLFIIYFFTYRKHFINELFVKENFSLGAIQNVPHNIANKTLQYSQSNLAKAEDLKQNAIQNKNAMDKLNTDREYYVGSEINKINNNNDALILYRQNINRVNRALYNIRYGDPTSDIPIERLGTLDTTLAL